jgi:hypothetical protein
MPSAMGGLLAVSTLAIMCRCDEWKILELLLANPGGLDREVVSDATGFKRSTRDAYLLRLAARELVVAERGAVKAADVLL